jgi:ABC-type multidrug transport system fused ATPase/permease subunit
MKDLFNAAIQGNKSLFMRAVIIALASLMFVLILKPVFVHMYRKATKKIMKKIRLKAFNHMTELPIFYFEREHTGNIMSMLTNDIKIIEDIYDIHINRMVFTLFLGAGSTIFMFIYNWKLALYAAVFEILSVLTSAKIAKKIRRISGEVQTERSKVNQKFIDIISGFTTTKIFQIENVIINNYKNQSDKLTDKEKSRDNLNALINAVGLFFYSFKSTGLIILGIYMVLQKQTDIGTFIALYNLQNNMGVLSNLGGIFGKLQASMAGIDRVGNLLEEKAEFHKYEDSANKEVRDSMIELKDIVFSYGEKKVLDNISILAKKGESIALVGKSGCGKSTIAKLLLGFYESHEGDIFIDGKSISNYSLSELRNKIAYVPQNPYLFDGSIMDNIRYGRLDSTDEEIVNSAKAANAHDFIIEQAAGYDTLIGEGGANLSGGQKQRIAIARAINKGSSVLLLDEATSALDSESEEKITQAIEEIMKEKTVLIIAHRLSTIKNVGKIYLIDEGKVLECGNHQELIFNKGLYYNFFEIQCS